MVFKYFRKLDIKDILREKFQVSSTFVTLSLSSIFGLNLKLLSHLSMNLTNIKKPMKNKVKSIIRHTFRYFHRLLLPVPSLARSQNHRVNLCFVVFSSFSTAKKIPGIQEYKRAMISQYKKFFLTVST